MTILLAILQKMRGSSQAEVENLRAKLIDALNVQEENTLNLAEELEFSEQIDNDLEEPSAEDIHNLFTILASVPKITELSFHSFVMNEPMMQAIAQGIKTNTTIESLDLSNTEAITDAGFSTIIDAILINKTVIKLNLNNNTQNRGINVTKSLQLLSHKPNFESLDLGDIALTDTEIHRIAQNLKYNPRLKYLNLSNNYISPINIRWIALSLLKNTRLEVLDMSNNRFDTESLIELVKNFMARPASVKLIIGGQHITAGAINALGELMTSNNFQLARNDTLLEFVNLSLDSMQALDTCKSVKDQTALMSAMDYKKAIQFSESAFQSKLSITDPILDSTHSSSVEGATVQSTVQSTIGQTGTTDSQKTAHSLKMSATQ